jgi:hypothetical protein
LLFNYQETTIPSQILNICAKEHIQIKKDIYNRKMNNSMNIRNNVYSEMSNSINMRNNVCSENMNLD